MLHYGLILFLVLLFIITIMLTLYALRQEDEKMKKYEKEDTAYDELKRSHEYEKTSIRTYLPIQIWIYVIFFLVGGIIFFLYVYYYV